MAALPPGKPPALNEVLKEGGRSLTFGRHLLRRVLVVAEFALALTLLAGGGLALHSLWNLWHADVGFATDHLFGFGLPIPNGQLKNAAQINAFYGELLNRIQALPGITSVAASPGLPPFAGFGDMPFQIAGKPFADPSTRPSAGFQAVTPGYFETFGIRMERGRTLRAEDRADSVPVAVVNESFAKRYLAGLDPLQQRIAVSRVAAGIMKFGPAVEWRIVGVYHDLRNRGPREDIFPEIDVPFAQNPWPQARITVRSEIDPATLTRTLAAVVQSMDSNLPLAFPQTMDQLLAEVRSGDRFRALLFGAFAAIALMLAALGIYGVMSFAVAQRTHEIGLRMALGAGNKRVLRLIVGEGMTLALFGLALGFGGALAVGHVMRGMWFQVGTVDAPAFSAVAVMLLSSALLACYLPARRATQVDPMQALREE